MAPTSPAATAVPLSAFQLPAALAFNNSRRNHPSSAAATNPFYPSIRYQRPNPSLSSESLSLPPSSMTIGDCIVFEDGAFDDGVASEDEYESTSEACSSSSESLVPSKWKDVVEEINLSKKEKRRIAHRVQYGSRVNRRKLQPAVDLEAYREYRQEMLSRQRPLVLDDPVELVPDKEPPPAPPAGRARPRNPREEIVLGSIDDIVELFNSENYVPGGAADDKNSKVRRQLFTSEEKVMLNKSVPKLDIATSEKWLPLHSLAASGEFYLLDKLLKHSVDINAVDKDGLSAIHKAIISKKQAIINYLLRNSANPFIRDKDGATLMHYAVHAACTQTIKILILYNADINHADDYGWTPLHLAVQTRRTDVVKLLLLKGADRSKKNNDGLTPLELCLYAGKDVRTYEVIKLLKGFQRPREMPEFS